MLGADQGPILARVLPPIMVGNLTAVMLSGILAAVGRKRPYLSGNGDLQPGGDDLIAQAEAGHGVSASIHSFAGAILLATTLYLCGVLTATLWGWPAPVVMLFLAVILTLAHLVTPRLKAGAGVMYRGALQMLAFPVLFIFSLTQTPWTALLAGFTPANLAVIVATVIGMVLGGFVAARWVNLYPIESAIVTATHSGMGGRGRHRHPHGGRPNAPDAVRADRHPHRRRHQRRPRPRRLRAALPPLTDTKGSAHDPHTSRPHR